MNSIYRILYLTLTAILTFFGVSTATAYDKPIDNEHGGDPVIVETDDGTYYTFTTGGGIDIRKIVSFDDTTVLEQKTVYRSGNDGIRGQIWAPEIHKIGDRWYIISCAVFDENTVPRGKMPEAEEGKQHDDFYRYGFVLESKTEDIFGEYEFKGYLAPDGLNNIDGTYLQKDGKLYYVSSSYMDVGHQCIYITEMENPYTLKTDENGNTISTKLSSPQYSWERKGWKVNEGPAVLYHEDDIFIVYSASGYSSGYYCMGMLTLKGDDVMNSKDWYKSKTRVHYNDPFNDIYNAGHCSFLYRESGEIYMVYHATTTEVFEESPRVTFIKKIEFNKFGRPIFY